MNYTGYISMVETNISGCCHIEFKIALTSVFLNFLKTLSDGNWMPKSTQKSMFYERSSLMWKM